MTYVAAAAILTMAFGNGSIGCFESATAQLPKLRSNSILPLIVGRVDFAVALILGGAATHRGD
jgi:hypothetical protein